MKSYDQLKTVSDEFFKSCHNGVKRHPWAIVIAMHEYFRNLFPADPYICFEENTCPTERVYKKTNELIEFLNSVNRIGAYEMNLDEKIKVLDVKDQTGNVYGKLWSKFSFEELTDKATSMLRERLVKNGFDMSYFHGKNAIDVGCGSGRHTFALKKLGCSSVIGVDYGDEGLKVANEIIEKSKIAGITFRKCNVLELPFDDNSFDFAYSNGVVHHTEDMERGIGEIIRIVKPGGKILLYLYGDGGVYWYARKRMPEIMKKIPQKYTMTILDLIGMPRDRFIFTDNWYVPIEIHTTDKESRQILSKYNISEVIRCEYGRSTDLEYMAIHGGIAGRTLLGDGALRYIITK